MTETEFQEIFSDRDIVPVAADLMVETSTIHYVYTDQHRDKLLVFIHGSPGSWSAFVDFFKNDSLLNDFDILSIDRPGFGDSDYGRPEKSMEKQAFYLNKVLEQFSQQRKILIGHSLGGPVIARMVMDRPNLVQGMVFVAPSIDPELEQREWYQSWLQTKAIGAMAPTDLWVSNEEIVPLKEELEEMLPLWRNVKIPAIVIQGTNDMLVPRENAEFARRMLSEALVEIRYLEGVNHFIPWSHPQEIVRAIYSVSERIE